jgi:hypothetical protein
MLGYVLSSGVIQSLTSYVPPINPNIATPPAPTVDMWTKAPANQYEADAIVQSIANQQMARQQGIDASQVKYVAKWIPSWMLPSTDNSVSDSTPFPWLVVGVVGIAVVGIGMIASRRR